LRRVLAIPLIAFAALTGGCAYDVTRLSHDCAGPGGWCPEARAVAGASWQYAQMAQNAYWEEALVSDDERDRLFVLPSELKERFASIDDRTGFAYSLFDRFEGDRLAEVVLVFRGTEGPKDWFYGNLLGQQGPRGLYIYRKVRADLDQAGYADVPLTLAGHSLGGRIASHVLKKLAREDGPLPATLSSYIFNPSVRAAELRRDRGDGGPVRIAISETGDVAAISRMIPFDDDWDGYVIDCKPGLSPIGQHYMRGLASCLTWIAARDDADAKISVERNELTAPPIEQQGKAPIAGR